MLFNTLITASALGLAASAAARGCGFKIAPCPDDSVCVPDSPDCLDLVRCHGTCVPTSKERFYPPCGGHRPDAPQCNEKLEECRDDPRHPTTCGLLCGGPGICIPRDAKTCGGIAGLPCPKGYRCYDMMNDDCDPIKGAADCLGICL